MDNNQESQLTLAEIAERKGVTEATFHIFLCTGPTCCSQEVGSKAWQQLKEKSAELKARGVTILRNKVGCLRICKAGPVAVVYPKGAWYHSVDHRFCETLLDSLANGEELSENCFIQRPLGG
jgi:(2Fe-2S) ferredoxin